MNYKILPTLIMMLFTLIANGQTITNKFPTDGNVGIGTNNPLKKLEAWVPANDYISVGNGISAGQYTGVHFGYMENNDYYRKSALVFERIDEAARGKIHILNNGMFTPASTTLADARLTINYDGKVGINNTNPEANLDINGEVKWSGYNAGNSRALKMGYSGGNYGGIGYNVDFKETTGLFNRPLMDRSSYMEFTQGGFRFFGTNTAVASNNVSIEGGGNNFNFLAILTNTGDLGIGTQDTKGYKLAVNGKIRTQEIKVEASNWPDYVFSSDYKITSLLELDKYIKANNHLPEIPSAAEVEKNGFQLGEMNKLLLKKVEELTLHLIEQNEKINKISSELKKLQRKKS